MALDLRRPLRRPRLASGLVTGATVALAAVVAVPALGAGPAAPPAPSPVCPAGTTGANAATTTANGQVIAGYTVSALAAGFRYQLNSPGLLPVGDAQVGTIMEYDVPFARISVGEGPVIDSLGSPVYPGDTAARLGSALGTFGAPGVPNDPVLAESNYPPSPQYPTSAQFNQAAGGTGSGAASASSTATQTDASANADVTAASLANAPGGKSPLQSASGDTTTTSDIGAACVDATAQSRTGAISIAGVIAIGSVVGYAATRSDGTTAVPEATLKVGAVTVGGLPAFIDASGIHLASQQPVGAAVVQVVSSQLQKTLASKDMTIKLIQPSTTTKGGLATADSGGVEVTMKQTLPGVGQPPAGTAPLPLQNIVEYGAASTSVDATTAPAPGSSSSPPVASGGSSSGTGTGVTPLPAVSGGTSGPGDITTGSPGSAVTPPTPTSGIGGQALAATPISAVPPRGSPAPIGWILVGILLAITATAPLLGYARWQLLEGRI
jgi:hypothetical protein